MKKRSFLLFEVLVSLTLIGLFMPNLLKDVSLYGKKVKKLEFLNEFENVYREKLFYVFYDLQKENLVKLENLSDQFQKIPLSEKITVFNKEYPSYLLLKKTKKEGANYQVSAILQVDNLPFGINTYQNEPQHYYLPKPTIHVSP